MSLEIVGFIGIGIMLVLMFLRMPLGAAMALVGFVGFGYIVGPNQGFFVLSSTAYKMANSYMLTTLPLFVLMAIFAGSAGMSRDAFITVNKWVGHLPGGLAMATTVACAGFAAVCGSSIATAATMCTVAFPEMRRFKYSDEISLGSICCGGQLGYMIPPSIPFILYAFLTEESVGALFMAGIFPGLLITLLFIITIFILTLRNPHVAPAGPRSSWKEKFVGIYPIWGIATLIAFVLIGIYLGFFTPTEAGAVGAFGALILGLVKRQITWKGIIGSLSETGQVTSMIFLLIIGSTIFGSFMAVSELPFWIAEYIGGLKLPSTLILVAILLVYIITGFFMEIIGVMVLTVPIIHPLLLNLGIDPVWFGVLVVLTIMIGGITPPVGIVVYAVAGLVKDAPLHTIFRGVWPFLVAMLIAMVILIVFPQISLWLPSMMMR